MDKYYTVEKHTQILIALMKFHGVRKIVASPGTTNVCFVGSLQCDPFFEMYSSVDERSAAFIACGMAAESGEPVAICCTGSTASRNYVPGLTEAYYRQLPILAITASQHLGRVGTLSPQVIDRSQQMKDMVKESVVADCVYTEEDEKALVTELNRAFIALRRNGGGPVHINLVTTYSIDYSARSLPNVRGIRYIADIRNMPSIKKYKRIAILVGVHKIWEDELLNTVDCFCKDYNAVVLMNHASNYKGKYGVNHAVIMNQNQYHSPLLNAELVIYIGSVSRYASGMKNAEIWRVNPDGEIRDAERKITHIFAMEEKSFFEYYCMDKNSYKKNTVADNHYAAQWKTEYAMIMKKLPDIPFSNVWIAEKMSSRLPDNSVFHLAGSNTARAWNFFKIPEKVRCHSNDGTMGIDGQVSAMIGESLATKDQLHFGAVGDLTFFYDMNSIGNHHIGSNFRLMIVNNGRGTEFRLYSHPAAAFGENADYFMAAAGHYGNKSRYLLKHYAEDLGFEYLTASSKDEFLSNMERFVTPQICERPMIFEVFTDSEDENRAIYAMHHIIQTSDGVIKDVAKGVIKSIAGDKGIEKVKGLIKR